MPKTMLINVTHAEESRVGIVEDGILASFEIEAFSREHLKGNIYKGVVHRIHPALEAAFVDIGAERDAFLPLDEICFRHLPTPLRNGGNGEEGRRKPRIKDILKPGEEILVQIVKEQFGNKPPTLSTFYSLPGRYLVLLPGSDEAGISRKIEGTERTRIRELIERLNPPEGFGIIVRTAAGFDEGSRELQRDLSYLLRLWETIRQAAASKRAPALIYREHDLVLRTIRDYFTPDVDEIYIDNEEVFQRARDFLRDVMPGKEEVLHGYRGDQPIFSHFNVEAQIESIYKRRVPLKSGGGIVIDGTEALTAIDVNSGRSIRGSNQEDTAFRTNMEAATEIARQLRLRDVGGLIVIDFIDMRSPQHNAEVEKTLREAMRQDKARHDIGRISHFGLLEISRQRLRPAVAATAYTACPMCEGHGLVRTTESAALVVLRKIHNRVAQGDVAGLRVSIPPDVGLYLLNQKRDDVAQLERRYATRIQVALNTVLMPHQSELEVRTRVEAGQPELPQIRLGGVAPIEPAPPATGDAGEAAAGPGPETAAVTAAPAAAGAAAAETPTTGKRRRRRRGRRRGRGRQAAAAIGEALAALGAHTSLVRERSEETVEPSSADDEGAPAPAAVTEGPSEMTAQRAVTEQPEITPGPASEARAIAATTAPVAAESPPKPRARRTRTGTSGRKQPAPRTRKQVAPDATSAGVVEAKTKPPASTPRQRSGRKRTAARPRRRTRSKAAPVAPESPS
jgi:ribonuclease E